MLKTRILTALVLIPLFLAALFWLPVLYWQLLVLVIALLAANEWAQLSGFSTPLRVGYVVAIGALYYAANLLPSAQAAWINWTHIYIVALIFWLVVAPLWLAREFQTRNPLVLALTGVVIILPTALAMLTLRRPYELPYELLLLMATVWISDSAAYFVGRKFGKHKLAPRISPGKTWEGVGGALIGTLIYAGILQVAGFKFELARAEPHWVTTAMLLLLACFGIVGDLFESWMKRCAGVKDSGKLLPGHGGVLDRIDALTSTLPIAALLLVWIWQLKMPL